MGTACRGHLDGGRADAAGAAVQQQPLPCREPPALEDVGPHSEERFGDGRRFDHRKARRDGQALLLGRHATLRVAAARHERADRLPLAPAPHAFAHGTHGARHFQSRDVGRPWRRRVLAVALDDVRAVHAGGVHVDQHLARAGHRIRPLDDTHPLRRAERRDLDTTHGSLVTGRHDEARRSGTQALTPQHSGPRLQDPRPQDPRPQDLPLRASPHFNPDGSRGEDSSAVNSRQRRSGAASRPARASTYCRTRSLPRL